MEEKNELKLNHDEVICDKCNGTGFIGKKSLESNSWNHICPKCLGTGKLTWTERITGRRTIPPGYIYAPYNITANSTTSNMNSTQLKQYSKLIGYNSTELKGNKK